MPKSPDAFRTISEVADWLGIQAHVLRFWESKFTQVKPIKRAGGRRYYRPADMLLLGGIKKLLHDDGLTIKGVQKLLREEGMTHVAALSAPLEGSEADEAVLPSATQPAPAVAAPSPPPQAVVLAFEPPKEPQPVEVELPVEAQAPQDTTAEPSAPEAPESALDPVPAEAELDLAPAPPADDAEEENAQPPTQEASVEELATASEPQDTAAPLEPEQAPAPEPDSTEDPDAQADTPPVEEIAARSAADDSEFDAAPAASPSEPAVEEPTVHEPAPDAPSALPSFLRHAAEAQPEAPAPTALQDAGVQTTPARDLDLQPLDAPSETTAAEADSPVADAAAQADTPVASEPAAAETPPPAPKARDIGMPVLTPEHEIVAAPRALSQALRLDALDAQSAAQIAPVLAQLASLRDRMAARRSATQPNS